MHSTPTTPLALAQEIAARYAVYPQVEAVVLAGSQTAGTAGTGSDIDLYVYLGEALPIEARRAIATVGASRSEVDNQFWEPGEEWVDAGSGISVDVMFRDFPWIEGQLDRLLREHQGSVGYSTAFWHNVLSSQVLFDRAGRFAALHAQASQPYPEPLRRAIVAKNYPILRSTISAYTQQLRKAVARGDAVSINHRVAALLASYFDIVFALNREPHPGEKRLIAIVEARCSRRPPAMRAEVEALIRTAGSPNTEVLGAADTLLDSLDRLLVAEGFDLEALAASGGRPVA